jgi:hypothetical protein
MRPLPEGCALLRRTLRSPPRTRRLPPRSLRTSPLALGRYSGDQTSRDFTYSRRYAWRCACPSLGGDRSPASQPPRQLVCVSRRLITPHHAPGRLSGSHHASSRKGGRQPGSDVRIGSDRSRFVPTLDYPLAFDRLSWAESCDVQGLAVTVDVLPNVGKEAMSREGERKDKSLRRFYSVGEVEAITSLSRPRSTGR